MALYVTADLHLGNADTVDKPMEIFGKLWENHIERLTDNCSYCGRYFLGDGF